MFTNYYKLKAQPFGVTPDTRFLYLSPAHKEAMASVFCSVMQNRGFTALIAHPGMGKTTLIFDILQKLPASQKTVFLFQTQCDARDLLRSILREMDVQDAGDNFAAMQAKLNEALLREMALGKRVVVLVDEAQNLDESVLEVLRVLSNFETAAEKLLHIVLSGQPQLAKKLASPAMVQLRQRVSAIARLLPFNSTETRAYVEHRLKVAGYEAARPLFTDRAYDLISVHSHGVPRNISNICFHAMSVACALQQKCIGHEIIREVLRDLDLRTLQEEASRTEPVVIPEVVVKPVLMKSPERKSRPTHRRWSVKMAALGLCLPSLMAYRHAETANRAKRPTYAAAKAIVARSEILFPSEIVSGGGPVYPANNAAPDSKTISKRRMQETFLVRQEEFRTVRIGEAETLYGLCIRMLGKYDEQVFHEVQQLNPWLSDPKQIPAGQPIQIPLRDVVPNGKEAALEFTILKGKKHE